MTILWEEMVFLMKAASGAVADADDAKWRDAAIDTTAITVTILHLVAMEMNLPLLLASDSHSKRYSLTGQSRGGIVLKL